MKISREKAALGFFAFLALAGLGVLLAYIIHVGHQLNVAASNIDAATGNLEGYTVVMCEGTAVEKKETVIDASSLEGNITSRVINRESQGASENSDEVSAEDVAKSEEQNDSEEKEKLTVTSLRHAYLQKQASVMVLDVKNPAKYLDYPVVRAGKYLFGVVYLDEVNAKPHYLKNRVEWYKEKAKANFIIVVVKDLSLMKSYEGADCVVSLQNEGIAASGASLGGVFYEDAPMVGQVGTMLISPSRTITAKDVTTL